MKKAQVLLSPSKQMQDKISFFSLAESYKVEIGLAKFYPKKDKRLLDSHALIG